MAEEDEDKKSLLQTIRDNPGKSAIAGLLAPAPLKAYALPAAAITAGVTGIRKGIEKSRQIQPDRVKAPNVGRDFRENFPELYPDLNKPEEEEEDILVKQDREMRKMDALFNRDTGDKKGQPSKRRSLTEFLDKREASKAEKERADKIDSFRPDTGTPMPETTGPVDFGGDDDIGEGGFEKPPEAPPSAEEVFARRAQAAMRVANARGVERQTLMQDDNYQLGSGSALRRGQLYSEGPADMQTSKSIQRPSAAIDREARRAQRRGDTKTASQLRMQAAQARLKEGSAISTPERREQEQLERAKQLDAMMKIQEEQAAAAAAANRINDLADEFNRLRQGQGAAQPQQQLFFEPLNPASTGFRGTPLKGRNPIRTR